MSYCHERGLPHSHFLGGPNRWLPEDRAKTLAFVQERAERCSRCGTAPWQWADDPYAFEPILEVCEGCQKLEAMDTDNKPLGAVKRLVPKAVARRLRDDAHASKDVVERRRRRRA